MKDFQNFKDFQIIKEDLIKEDLKEEIRKEERQKNNDLYNNSKFKFYFKENLIDKYLNDGYIDSIDFMNYKYIYIINIRNISILDLVSDYDYNLEIIKGDLYEEKLEEIYLNFKTLKKFENDFKDCSIEIKDYVNDKGRTININIPITKFEKYFKDVIKNYKSSNVIKKYDL